MVMTQRAFIDQGMPVLTWPDGVPNQRGRFWNSSQWIAGISTSTDLMDFQDTSEFSNALVIHQVQTKEIMTVTVFGYPILISMDFYDFSSPSTP